MGTDLLRFRGRMVYESKTFENEEMVDVYAQMSPSKSSQNRSWIARVSKERAAYLQSLPELKKSDFLPEELVNK